MSLQVIIDESIKNFQTGDRLALNKISNGKYTLVVEKKGCAFVEFFRRLFGSSLKDYNNHYDIREKLNSNNVEFSVSQNNSSFVVEAVAKAKEIAETAWRNSIIEPGLSTSSEKNTNSEFNLSPLAGLSATDFEFRPPPLGAGN